MSRWKKILLAAGLVLVALIAAIYAFAALYDFNNLKPAIARAVEDATGRQLNIAGNVEFKLGLRPALTVEGVSLKNAAWSSTPNMIRVKRLQARIDVLPLLAGKLIGRHSLPNAA